MILMSKEHKLGKCWESKLKESKQRDGEKEIYYLRENWTRFKEIANQGEND